jgi:hypothetical protein
MQNQGKQLVIEEFVKEMAGIGIQDKAGNAVIFQPSDLSINADESGKDTVNFKISNRDRWLYELLLIINNEAIAEKDRAEVQAAIQDLTLFVQELNFEFKDGNEKGVPEILCEIADPGPLRFYADSSDPDYIHYLQQLAIQNEYLHKGEPVPDELQAFCDESAVRFFEGHKNEQMRYSYMRQAVQFYINLPLVNLAALSVLYTKEELRQLLEKPKKSQKAKKAQVVTMPFYKAGHLVDQQLNYNYPPDSVGQQTSLF